MYQKLATSTLAFTILGLGFVGSRSASAAVFNFSFSNEDGSVNGTIEGTIELPDGDGILAATSLVVSSAPDELGFTIPIDILEGVSNVVNNTFTVTNASIDIANTSFGAVNSTEGFALNFGGGAGISFLNTAGTGEITSGVLDVDSSTLVITAVPEPLTILGAGAAVAFGTGFKRKLGKAKKK